MESNYNNNFATRENASIALKMADLMDLQTGDRYIEPYYQPQIIDNDLTYGTIAMGQGNPELDSRLAATRQPKLHYPDNMKLPTHTRNGGFNDTIPAPVPLSEALMYVRNEMQNGVGQLSQMENKPGEYDKKRSYYPLPSGGYMNHTKGGDVISKRPVKEKKGKSTKPSKNVLSKLTDVKPKKKSEPKSDGKKISGKFSILNKVL